MPDAREAQFLQRVADFPDSPMSHYSLGRLYLDTGRGALAVAPLMEAVRLQPDYAAALLALGTACAEAGQADAAREAWIRARDAALRQNHPTLADEADALCAELNANPSKT